MQPCTLVSALPFVGSRHGHGTPKKTQITNLTQTAAYMHSQSHRSPKKKYKNSQRNCVTKQTFFCAFQKARCLSSLKPLLGLPGSVSVTQENQHGFQEILKPQPWFPGESFISPQALQASAYILHKDISARMAHRPALV